MRIIDQHEFKKILEDTYLSLVVLTDTKGVEYAGAGSTNQHANIDRLSDKLGIHPMKILSVLMTKHLDAIDNYIKNIDAVVRPALSESIEGRIDDAILYLILLKAMVERYRVLRSLDNDRRSTGNAPDFRGYVGSSGPNQDKPENSEAPRLPRSESTEPPVAYVGPGIKNSPAFHLSSPSVPIDPGLPAAGGPVPLDNRPSWQRGK